MHNLLSEMILRSSNSLARKAITSCSAWAEKYRVMGNPFPGPWRFDHHPWTRDMHDTKAEMNVGMKSAQMGYTETVLNIAFYSIDILNHDVLYVLPNKNPDAGDFSAARFDAALEMSPHLASLFSDVKNVGHKRAGSANMYIRGSQSRTGLKSIATPKVILDELDEFEQSNIPLAFERASGQLQESKLVFMLSTPTIDKYGVHKYYLDSTQEHYFFNCPHCSKLTELVFPKCLVITGDDFNDPKIENSHIICQDCGKKLDHEKKHEYLGKGKWVEGYTNRDMRGFHVNQLYSFTVTPKQLAVAYLKSKKDPAQEQEFYNSKLGIPHIVDGARVNDKHLADCRGSFRKHVDGTSGGFVTMGVDVGKWLHVEIDAWTIPETITQDLNASSKSQLIFEGKVQDFEDLDVLMHKYGVRCCVIDANPEKRKATEFAKRFPGRVYICYYANNVRGKQLNINEDEYAVSVDRTSWLDQSLGRFKNKSISLPIDLSLEYQDHAKAQVRVYKKDKDGNMTAVYQTGTDEDHFGHARNYVEISLPLAFGIGVNKDMGEVL